VTSTTGRQLSRRQDGRSAPPVFGDLKIAMPTPPGRLLFLFGGPKAANEPRRPAPSLPALDGWLSPAPSRADAGPRRSRREWRVAFDWTTIGPVMTKSRRSWPAASGAHRPQGRPDPHRDELRRRAVCLANWRPRKDDIRAALRATNDNSERRFRQSNGAWAEHGRKPADATLEKWRPSGRKARARTRGAAASSGSDHLEDSPRSPSIT